MCSLKVKVFSYVFLLIKLKKMEIENNFSGIQSKQSTIGGIVSGKASTERPSPIGIETGTYNNTPKYLSVHLGITGNDSYNTN